MPAYRRDYALSHGPGELSSRSTSNSPPVNAILAQTPYQDDTDDEFDHGGHLEEPLCRDGSAGDRTKHRTRRTTGGEATPEVDAQRDLAGDKACDGTEDEHGDRGSDQDAQGGAADAVPGRQEGMLPRDIPETTAVYNPVVDRQMIQADFKQIYQQELLKATGQQQQQFLPGTSVPASPVIHTGVPEAASRPSTAGATSAGPSYSLGPHDCTPDLVSASMHSMDGSIMGGRGDAGVSGVGLGVDTGPGVMSAGPGASQGPMATAAAASSNTRQPTGIGSTSYADNDPQITSELKSIFMSIHAIIQLRRKYIRLSLQGPLDNPKDESNWEVYPTPPQPVWPEDPNAPGATATTTGGEKSVPSIGNSPANSTILSRPPAPTPTPAAVPSETATQSKPTRPVRKRKPGQDIGEDFEIEDLYPLPGECAYTFRIDDNGVYQVFADDGGEDPITNIPTLRTFYGDLETILTASADGPSKTFAYRRLQYLEGKFGLYTLVNDYQETAETKKVPHRDFYNVRKVDTHVHHSACMNQKHLLRFIKSKIRKCPDETVLFRDGKHLTLTEVFESIKLTAYDLSIDTLDMHAHKDTFHRFDKFNLKYNPIGESRLRTIFLKTDNDIDGRYLAEITKEVISDLESSKYQMAEWRISIYGKSIGEWEKLAAWVVDNKLFSHNIRWLIQIPRLFDVYKASGLMESFDQVIRNVFEPLFEATKNPQKYPKLHVFLQRVIGFDSVDDESKVERRLFNRKFPAPQKWNWDQNPPYSYWIYHLYANMTTLNAWRKARGFNTFVLRPHCGEAGDSEHLAVALLCSHSISHGLLLRKVPLLQYIYYLEQIGIAMSPLSNNALFLAYERNPFHQYFKRGLNVSLSTDDPLQFAYTKEPLMEEYAVAAQIYKLSPVDMCELARNSVVQSGYEYSIKKQWLGDFFDKPGPEGNNINKTNIPDRRQEFRFSALMEEWQMIKRYTQPPLEIQAEGDGVALSDIIATTAPLWSVALPLSASQQLQAGQASGPHSASPSAVATGHSAGTSFVTLPAAARTDAGYGLRSSTTTNALGNPNMSGVAGGAATMTPGSLLASPLMMSRDGAWFPEGTMGAAGSGIGTDANYPPGTGPRYLPGVITRSQRRNSLRKGSTHETD